MTYSVLNSYAEKHGALWKLHTESGTTRRNELNIITAMIAAVGKRLGYSTRRQDQKIYQKSDNKSSAPFISSASALMGHSRLRDALSP